MKTKVIVKLVAECEVEIETTHEEDESPTDLTPHEERKALSMADVDPKWRVEWVKEDK